MSKYSFSQGQDYIRLKTISVETSQIFDTLCLIPGSISLSDHTGKKIDTSCYSVDPTIAKIHIKCPDLIGTTLTLKYRVFPFSLTKTYRNRVPEQAGKVAEIIRPYKAVGEETEWLSFGALSKNGSILREFSLGNTRDASVNSDLNMQLSGPLSEEIYLRAALTDKNIPVQPDGYTQQIQEFDRMYLEVYSKRNNFIGGDFLLTGSDSYFLKLNRKVRGGVFTLDEPYSQRDTTRFRIHVKGSGSVSKGKYKRSQMTPVEGVQGPYRLTGQANELYIMVLAGSEKIYIDGVLLKRGEEYDYVIDYNTAELTFTVRQPITKDKRITAEFEYADRKYARSMFYNGADISAGKIKFGYEYLTEQDLKNQPLLQDLSSEQKLFMSTLGSDASDILYPGMQEVPYNENEVLYKLIDTTLNSVLYDSVYVFSVNKDSARFRLSFTQVGPGNGHYKLAGYVAGGRVFTWVAPVGGFLQGEYEPVIVLSAPQKNQQFSTYIAAEVLKNTKARFEWSMSAADLNTFSSQGPKLRNGYAARISIENNSRPMRKDTLWRMRSSLAHEWVNPYYTTGERFRPVEYERDWMLNASAKNQDEFLTAASWSLSDARRNSFALSSTSRYKGADDLSFKHNAVISTYYKTITLNSRASLMQSKNNATQTDFVRQYTTLTKRVKSAEIGVRDDMELCRQTFANSDSLTASAFQYNEYEFFIADADSSEKRYKLFYKNRTDLLPQHTTMEQVSIGQTAGAELRLASGKHYRAGLVAAYRDLATDLQARDNSFVGRTDHSINALKGALLSQTFYETGNSMEQKKEYRYIQVPVGQGIYSWTDYNHNGIKELDEFNTAVYRDEASYIRVYTPTNEYIRATLSSVSQLLDFNPALRWKQQGWRALPTKLSVKSTATFSKKTTEEQTALTYLPFLQQLEDTSVVSMNAAFRNILYINRNNSKFGTEVMYDKQLNKQLQMNGFDYRKTEAWSLLVRGAVKQRYYLKLALSKGYRRDSSAYLINKNYLLHFNEVEPSFAYQPGLDYRILLGVKYVERKNTNAVNPESAYLSKLYTDVTINLLKNTSIQSRIEFHKIIYTATTNSTLAYVMLDGLKPGYNLTWNLSFQRDIASNLQLSVLYDGRKMPGNNVVHLGSLMLRAYF